jgi:hypothetical protein
MMIRACGCVVMVVIKYYTTFLTSYYITLGAFYRSVGIGRAAVDYSVESGVRWLFAVWTDGLSGMAGFPIMGWFGCVCLLS